LDHIVEDGCAYSDEQLAAEPTCKRCAPKWRKLQIQFKLGLPLKV
jgi:hypothetical protein